MSLISGEFSARIMQYLSQSERTLDDILLQEAGDRIKWAIKRQTMKAREDQKGVLRLSSGGQCVRKMYQLFHHGNPEQFAGRTQLNFLMGDIVEASLSVVARLSGWRLLGKPNGEDRVSIKVQTYGQRGEQPEEVEIPGHPDDLLEHEGKLYLIEFKTASTRSYEVFEKEGLDDQWGYLSQVNLYMHALGLKECVMVYYRKETGHMCDHIIKYDLNVVQTALERYRRVLNSPEIPDREHFPIQETYYKKPTGRSILPLQCSYACPFKDKCYPEFQMEFKKSGSPVWVRQEMVAA